MKMKYQENLSVKLFVSFALLILILTVSGRVFAGGYKIADPQKLGDWEISGPSGGDVRTITVDPRDKDRLYITTLDGTIFTSADAGKSWRLLVNFNKPQLILDQFGVDLRDSNILYASGHRHKFPGGFFKSTDAGLTWKESKELSKSSIQSMVQSSFDPNVMYVGTTEGVWVSKNSGNDWNKIESATMPVNVDSLAVDPRGTGTVYAGTWWRAYKSTDSGKNWRLIKNGMIDDSDVFAVTIDPRNPDHIVASACSGIYDSLNGGELWAKVNGIPSQSRRTRDIVQHPTIAGTVYAGTTEGFWMTTGKSWILTTQRDIEVNSIAVSADAPNRVYIGTNNYGVMVSNDGGKNFAPTNDNFTSRLTYSVIHDTVMPNRLYAATQNTATGGGFFFLSDNGGGTWRQAKSFDTGRISPFSMLQDRVNPNTLYLATNLGIFRSLDRGDSWAQVTASKPSAPVKKPVVKRRIARGKTKVVKPVSAPISAPVVAAVPVDTTKLIPALTAKVKFLSYTEDGKNGIYAATDNGLYRSYDLAKGWEKINLGAGVDENIFVIYTNPQQPETVWAGTSVSGVLVSRDNGTTWQKTGGAPEGVPVSTITADPKRPDYIYVGTSQTLYLTRDGGKNWMRRGGNLPLGNYTSVLINPNKTDEVYVSSAFENDGGIYYSENAGGSWKRMDSKDMKLPSRRVWSMTFDPNDSNKIYAGTHSSGVYIIERKPEAAVVPTVTAEPITVPAPVKTDSLGRSRIAGNN